MVKIAFDNHAGGVLRIRVMGGKSCKAGARLTSGFEQVADFGQKLDIRGNRRRFFLLLRSAVLGLEFILKPVKKLHHHKNNQRGQ